MFAALVGLLDVRLAGSQPFRRLYNTQRIEVAINLVKVSESTDKHQDDTESLYLISLVTSNMPLPHRDTFESSSWSPYTHIDK